MGTAELIITAGGENIPPVQLEANILREIPFLSNVMIVGDKRPYLTCLMTLKVSLATDWGSLLMVLDKLLYAGLCML